MIRSLPLTALSLMLGFFFIFVGVLKISPNVNADIYRHMQNEFGRFNKVFPFFKYTGWRPFAKNYRLTVGITEVVCGSMLILVPGPLKELANLVLLGIMGGALYTLSVLKDPFEKMVPSLIFGLLLLCRLVILYQVNRREEKMIKSLLEKQKQKAAAEDANEDKKIN